MGWDGWMGWSTSNLTVGQIILLTLHQASIQLGTGLHLGRHRPTEYADPLTSRCAGQWTPRHSRIEQYFREQAIAVLVKKIYNMLR